MLPRDGYCQMCGKSNCSPKVSETSANFFCSSDCEEKYFGAKVGSLLLDPGIVVLPGENVDSREISAMQMRGLMLKAYCWFCGKRISVSDDKCPSCGKDQEIEL